MLVEGHVFRVRDVLVDRAGECLAPGPAWMPLGPLESFSFRSLFQLYDAFLRYGLGRVSLFMVSWNQRRGFAPRFRRAA